MTAADLAAAGRALAHAIDALSEAVRAENGMNQPRDYETAARELGVSQAWLEEYTPSIPLPHSKFAVDEAGKPSRRGRGAVRFYDEDIAAIRQMFAVRPSSVEKARVVGPVTRRK